MKSEQEWRTVDAAIATAVASLRDVADRLEAGPRQRAAEVLMRGSGAIEELSRQTDRRYPSPTAAVGSVGSASSGTPRALARDAR